MGAQERLLLLVGPEPGAQARSERSLDPVHGGLGKRSSAVCWARFQFEAPRERTSLIARFRSAKSGSRRMTARLRGGVISRRRRLRAPA